MSYLLLFVLLLFGNEFCGKPYYILISEIYLSDVSDMYFQRSAAAETH